MTIAAYALSIGAVLVTGNTCRFTRIAAPLQLLNRTA
jgi:predicted nucleic acid-binding protein